MKFKSVAALALVMSFSVMAGSEFAYECEGFNSYNEGSYVVVRDVYEDLQEVNVLGHMRLNDRGPVLHQAGYAVNGGPGDQEYHGIEELDGNKTKLKNFTLKRLDTKKPVLGIYKDYDEDTGSPKTLFTFLKCKNKKVKEELKDCFFSPQRIVIYKKVQTLISKGMPGHGILMFSQSIKDCAIPVNVMEAGLKVFKDSWKDLKPTILGDDQ